MKKMPNQDDNEDNHGSDGGDREVVNFKYSKTKMFLLGILFALLCRGALPGVIDHVAAFAPKLGHGNRPDNGGQVFNIKDYGARCDGSTNDTTAVKSANDAALTAGGSIYLPPSPGGCLVTNPTISVPVVTDGGSFKGTNGQTVTITKGISNPSNVVLFRNFLSGQARVILDASVTAQPEWWGGKPDGVTPNQTFITAALNCGAKRVFLSSGEWLLTSPIVMHDVFVTLTGASRVNTYISAGSGVASMIKFANPDTFAGGWVIENIRFHGFPQTGGTFAGYALDATDHTLIDSVVRNCWFGLSASAAGAFNGKAVDLLWESNGHELGVNTLHFTLAAMVRIHGNVFWQCSTNVIDLDGVVGSVNEVSITDNIIDFHHQGSAIRVKNGANVVISGLIYAPNDTISTNDLANSFPTVIELDHADVMVSNVKVAGCLAYADTDQGHTGKAYVKIKQVIKSANSTAKVTNLKASLTGYGIYATGSLVLSGSDLTFEGQGLDGIYIENLTGFVSLDHIEIIKPAGAFINQVGTTTADTLIRNSDFSDARWNGDPSTAFTFKTTGNFVFNNNTVVKDDGSSKVVNFFDVTFKDGKAFFDNNLYSAPVVLGGAVFKAGSSGYREGINHLVGSGFPH